MRYAISDIHGCPKTFRHLLRQIDFSKEDELFLLGDYIDRGPDSSGVVEHIWELQQRGYTIRCLLGNHEEMLLDAMEQGKNGWDYAPPDRLYDRLYTWMNGLPRYFEIDGYVLVHAGLNFHRANPLQDTEALVWLRRWYDTVFSEWAQMWLAGRVIVHGHTPEPVISVRRGIEQMVRNQRVCIDSGCAMRAFGMQHLTALNLDTRVGVDVHRID